MIRPTYTPAQAEAIRQEAKRRGLEAPDSFWACSAELLARILNGIGPDWFPAWLREEITKRLGRFGPDAAIHDYCYWLSRGRWADFCEANAMFLSNCRRSVRKTIPAYRWWKRQEMYIDADLLYGAVCAGGWPGYLAGANQSGEG